MYNPYNWKIEKKSKENKLKCILDEMMLNSIDLDRLRIRESELKKELKEVEEDIIKLELRKVELATRFVEKP